MQPALSDRFHTRLMVAATRYQPGRRDHLRAEIFGGRLLRARRVLRDLKDQVLIAAGRAGLVLWTPSARQMVRRRLEEIEPLMASFEHLYARLVDDRSRDLLVELLVYRVLGHQHVTLSTSTPAYWSAYETADTGLRTDAPSVQCGGSILPFYRLPRGGRTVSLHTHPLCVLNMFLIEQYACRRPGFHCAAMPGDTVIDGGGCWGDTALYFAEQVGAAGRVHVFEFVRASLKVLYANLEANPSLRDIVDVIEHPIWDRAGAELPFSASGPATRVDNNAGDSTVVAESIDHLLETGRINRVDFIKLDVEGAERNALQGAVNAIRMMRPRLAISVYHRIDDFAVIPQVLESTGIHYRLALDHFTVHGEETVLFAVPEPEQ